MPTPRSQSRRSAFLVAVCSVALLLAVTQLLSTSRSQPVTFLDKYPQLKTGMTEDQITEILGRPPGDYTRKGHPGYLYRGGLGGLNRKIWCGEDCTVMVWFDSNGRAATIYQLLPLLED